MNITRIPVTQEHIDRGKPGNPNACPVYHALKERHWDSRPEVGTDNILIRFQDADGISWVQLWELAPELEDWIAAFDRGDAVSPFTLLLDRERGQARQGGAGPELPSNPAQGAAQG